MKKDFGITDELYGYERFIRQIVERCNDAALRKVFFESWDNFVDEQRKRTDVLPGWRLVETLNINDNGKVIIGLG